MRTPHTTIEDLHVDRSRLQTILLAVLVVLAAGTALKAAQSVFIPLVIAWLLSYILGPIVNFLTRLRVPTGLAVACVLLLALAACYLGGIFLHARVLAFADAFPRYHAQLLQLVDDWARRSHLATNFLPAVDWGAQVRASLLKLSGSLLEFVKNLVLVLVFLLFMLLAKPYVRYKLKRAFSSRDAKHINRVTATIARQIGRFLSVMFLISASTGVLVWFALDQIGVDFPVTWGALAFFLNFIPTLGSIVASIPPILVAIVQFHPSMLHAVLTLISLLAIQIVMGNVITPKVMGDTLNLSPVVVLLSLIFWGWLWGIVGALLSIPIAAAIRIVCANIDELKPLSVLMGSGKRYKAEESGDAGESENAEESAE